MKDFESLLRSGLEKYGVTGASFAYWDGVRVHTAVAGRRNSVTGDPVTADTVMHIGSITKLMNTILLMQLVDERRVTLDDPVARHLPELRLRDKEALSRITLRMLVNHTSGIDGNWLPEYGPDQERIVDTIARCAELGQLFAPGAATSYCNIATVIAGYLAQKLRGESWYTLIRRRILEPLKLTHSLVDIEHVSRFRCSVGDLSDPLSGQVFQTSRPFLAPSFAPAGSTAMMTAADLVTFGRTMVDGGAAPHGASILSSESAARMAQASAEFVSPCNRIGLGWMIRPDGVLTHGGAGPGVNSFLFAEPGGGRVLALLTNCDRGAVLLPEVVDPILELWTGRKVAEPVQIPDTMDVVDYAGIYESNTDQVSVVAENGEIFFRNAMKFLIYDNSVLLSSMDSLPRRRLTPCAVDEFRAPSLLPEGPETILKFVKPEGEKKARYLAMDFRLYLRTQ